MYFEGEIGFNALRNAFVRASQLEDLLSQGCRIGIETSVSLVAFIAAFLARAASDCAASMRPLPQTLGLLVGHGL